MESCQKTYGYNMHVIMNELNNFAPLHIQNNQSKCTIFLSKKDLENFVDNFRLYLSAEDGLILIFFQFFSHDGVS